MGSLGNATGAIEGSKHGLHATRAGTVRRGRNRAPGEFGDLVLSTSDADAEGGPFTSDDAGSTLPASEDISATIAP